jgi:hypothetical protein
LRKFYPWYMPRLGLAAPASKALQEELQLAPTLAHARRALEARLAQPAGAL